MCDQGLLQRCSAEEPLQDREYESRRSCRTSHEGDNLVPRVEELPFSRLVAYFLRLGTVGFGGPIALVGYMQRDLAGRQALGVDRRLFAGAGLFSTQPRASSRTARKLSRVDTQRNARRKAGWYCVRFAFSSDGSGTAAMYVHFGQLAWIQGMFYGIGAAVSAIIVRSAWRLIQKTLDKHYLLWTVFAILTVTTVWTESEILSLFVLSGIVAMLIKAPPGGEGTLAKAVIPPLGFVGVYAPAGTKTVMTVFLFFLKAGAFVFGSGLAIVPFIYGASWVGFTG
jgi:chromate transporter